jgi:hypothetical protein
MRLLCIPVLAQPWQGLDKVQMAMPVVHHRLLPQHWLKHFSNPTECKESESRKHVCAGMGSAMHAVQESMSDAGSHLSTGPADESLHKLSSQVHLETR